ncbi:hypothetical protein BCR32DRAFT_289400 [Anaeromyces robustus]|uniref:alpha-galactosidase n=1 Tax=Anaeromyces robustus TaxID=1754192 RepID=A0A1Y1XNE0_9FUNG|nr:hypothetical protein BCR32DRAFT_289400 [Anaeromyces robustus]|eukprot:ORX87277.1 hypothetical protein BCR32DRAFT_289400 [Anaeromyces robustus]
MNTVFLFLLIFIYFINIIYTINLNYTLLSNTKQKTKRNSSINIWIPSVGTTWNWILNSEDIESDNNVDVLDIDLFDVDAKTINKLKNKGHHIICYFSVGTYEKWRPDASEFLKVDNLVRDKMEEWNENYIDITNPYLKPIMSKRFDLAKEKGCDGIEPDNIDIYLSKKVKKWKIPITVEDQLSYDLWLTTEAHQRGLSIGMKNDIENASKMATYFDFAINEECYDYDECSNYEPFINMNKAVFTAAYGDCCDKKFLDKLEKNTKGKNLSIIIKNEDQELVEDYVKFDPDNYDYDEICNGKKTTTDSTDSSLKNIMKYDLKLENV